MTITTIPKGLFVFGKFVITPGLKENTARLMPYLLRHLKGDWGDIDEEDALRNDHAVKAGNLRIFSAYETDIVGLIWIITEADRSVTTLLLPGEY